ncbi:MAG: NAD(P)-dependent oxidoreductase, partial [Chloroflexi bacterium]|nr:NAD(P)-dependent oxidoreductase [Chloroflexota bacterium]
SAHGQAVVALDRDSATSLPCPTVRGDIGAPGFLAGLFHTYSFEAIVHLAAVRNTASQQRPDEAMRVNIGASLALLQLAQQFAVSKFIFGSSISAYGPKPYAGYGEVSESELAAPDNVYGCSKRYVEIVGEQYRQQGKLQFVALRIAMVVGAGVVSTASSWRGEIFEKLCARQHTPIALPYAGHEIIPLIHVADVAEIARRLVEAERTRYPIYNTPADNWTCGDLADYIGALNRNVALALTLSSTMARGDPEAIDGRRFAEEFGFKPLPMRERLRRALEREGGQEA